MGLGAFGIFPKAPFFCYELHIPNQEVKLRRQKR